MRSRINSLLLLLTSMIWGAAFVFQTTGGNATGPFTFSCMRFTLASIAMLPAIRLLDHLGLTANRPMTKDDKRLLWKAGFYNGLCLVGTSLCQQLGLYLGTAAGKAGFLTACYIVLVPLLGIFLKRRCGWHIWLSVAVTVVGLYLLCMTGSLSIQLSDFVILMGSLCCALHILVIDHYANRVEVVRMSAIQFVVAAVIAFVPMFWFDMGHSPEGIRSWMQWTTMPDAWISLLYVSLLSSAVGYTLQCIGQQGVAPALASLLMSLESVFSVIAGWLMLGQALSSRELIGCVLIFAAVIFAQMPIPGADGKKA